MGRCAHLKRLIVGLLAVAVIAWGAAQIGDEHAGTDGDIRKRASPVLSAMLPGPPWEAPLPTPTPTPRREDAPEPAPPAPSPTPAPRPERAAPEVAPTVHAQPASGEAVDAKITFYTCPPYCANPSGPLPLAEGQAACDPSWMGQRFILNDREYVCNDTGNAVWGAHVDLFFWDEADGWAYLAEHGTQGRIVLLP